MTHATPAALTDALASAADNAAALFAGSDWSHWLAREHAAGCVGGQWDAVDRELLEMETNGGG